MTAVHFPVWKGNGRPIMDMRRTVEGIVWWFRMGRPGVMCEHAIGKSRDAMTCKIHLATDGRGRPLGLVLTSGQTADTSFFQTVLEITWVAGSSQARPRRRTDRVLADKAYTSSANRGYLAGRGIKVTMLEWPDQIAG